MASASGIRMGKVFVEIGADPAKFFRALQGVQRSIGRIGASMTSLGTRMAGVGGAMAAPIALAARQFAQFDDAIRMTGAVSGATGAGLQKLNDTARELGATTSFTAVQVASLMTELGRAGFNPDEINAMTGAVLNLARATGTDATASAGIMAATLRQFSMGAGEAARVSDVLTKAANATFNTVEGLGESLKFAGPVAQSLGMSLEETVAVLGVLGNVGIQGSEAGTALRRLSIIAAGSGEQLQELFGISNTDSDGGLKPLVDILDEINQATANMPVAERTAKMAKAFGLLGITSANVLSSSAAGVRGLAEELRNAEGTAARTARQMDAGLGGAMRIAYSAIEGTALAIGEALAPTLQSLLETLTGVAGGITRFIKDNQELVVSIAKGVAIFTGVGLAILGVGTALTIVAGAMGLVLSPVGAILGAVVALGSGVVYFAGGLEGLADLATNTFSGIYAAIAEGDLAGAMDVLWAGLYAGWLRGVEGLMGAVDPWISLFQNTFTYLSTAVLNIWDMMFTGIAQAAVTFMAPILGIVDNIVNSVMNAFDTMVAAVRKSWNWVQSFIKRGYNLKKENDKVDSEMAAKRRKREIERPGIEGRQKEAEQQSEMLGQDSAKRQADRNAAADETYLKREQANQDRAKSRRRDTEAAEANVANMAQGKRDAGVQNDQFRQLLKGVESATSYDSLGDLWDEYDALNANGRLSSAQVTALQDAFTSAEDRIVNDMLLAGGESPSSKIQGGAGAAGQQAAQSQAEVAGTFSSSALGGMGFGSSLAQKQLEALGKIEQNTRADGGLEVAA
jgi:TP901 family phage tail tape measure protein